MRRAWRCLGTSIFASGNPLASLRQMIEERRVAQAKLRQQLDDEKRKRQHECREAAVRERQHIEAVQEGRCDGPASVIGREELHEFHLTPSCSSPLKFVATPYHNRPSFTFQSDKRRDSA